MESINRDNYEVWFLDYLDGQLNTKQVEALMDFLAANPGLKEELDSVSGISLVSGSESVDFKEVLLKNESDIPGIAADDQLCIARMENDLSNVEAAHFDARMKVDAGLESRYEAFLLTRLDPRKAVVFPFKQDLRKKTIVLMPWIITAISSAAVILLAWFLWPDSGENKQSPIAQTEVQAPSEGKTLSPEMKETVESPQLALNSHPKSTEGRKQIRRTNPGSGVAESPAVTREFVPMNTLSSRYSPAALRIPDPESARYLLASNNPAVFMQQIPEQDVLTLPQYALQMFRERVLGQERSLVRKTRFTLWEVAGAGLDKINSVAGTQMKLNRDYDEQGDLMAVSFNSRLIDVETPVKAQSAR